MTYFFWNSLVLPVLRRQERWNNVHFTCIIGTKGTQIPISECNNNVQCPQGRTIILYILYFDFDHLSNTLKAYIAPCPDTFEAKIMEMAAAMARCHAIFLKLLIGPKSLLQLPF